jgi:hypothetical protein
MAGGIALCLVVACGNDGPSEYAARLQCRTTPPGGSSTPINLVRTTNASQTFAWDVSTGWSAERYSEWLAMTLRDDFTRSSSATNVAVFTRRLSGDVYRLECQVVSGEGEIIVHIIFIAVAD